MFARSSLVAAIASLALTACSQSETAAPTQEPTAEPTLVAQPVRTAAADGTRLTPGLWNIGESAAGASATFVVEGQASPALSLSCDRATRTVGLTLAGAAPTTHIQLGGVGVDLELTPAAGGQASAAIDPTQPVFAGWANPSEVIAIGDSAAPGLKIPGHVGVGRVFAACG